MSAKHPTPWTFSADDEFEDTPIRDANGEYVLIRDSGVYPPDLETCREIVEAVNERDLLCALVRRLAQRLQMARLEGFGGPDRENLLDEAREALGKAAQ